MKPSRRKARGTSTVFDDVYRTMVQKMPMLMIPLINEVFHTDYPEDIAKAQLRNEHLEIQKKLITDSILKISGRTYHIECQSTPDGQMALRMFEYGAAIALDETRQLSSATDGVEHIRFPYASVLYLRSTEQTPSALTAIVDFPDGQQVRYRVPLVKVQSFPLDEIMEKRLFLFLPFYLLRYEKDFPLIESDDERLAQLLAEYKTIAHQLNLALTEDDHTTLYGDLVKLITRISDYLLQSYRRTRKGVDDTMGGKILELYSEKLLRRGKAEGRAEGKSEGVLETLRSLVKKGLLTIPAAAKELGVSEEDFKKMAML